VIAVIGKNEVATRSVSVRKLGSIDQETIAVTDFVDKLIAETKAPF
jgi:threonyl-tRNA synthetase